jgi:hypothetical protein
MRGVRSLGSIVGDNKAADSIEDTAVELSDLPNYIAEFLCDDEASQSRGDLLRSRRRWELRDLF